jgi:hypothetical protein
LGRLYRDVENLFRFTDVKAGIRNIQNFGLFRLRVGYRRKALERCAPAQSSEQDDGHSKQDTGLQAAQAAASGHTSSEHLRQIPKTAQSLS